MVQRRAVLWLDSLARANELESGDCLRIRTMSKKTTPAAAAVATSPVVKSKPKRLTMAERISQQVAEQVALALSAANRPTPTPIPSHVQAMVNAGIISQEQAQAMADNPAFKVQQQGAADDIPSPVLVQEIRKHKPAGVITIRKGNRNVELFSYPIATKPATGNDYTDRDAMGYHKAKSILMVVDQLKKFVEASELKRVSAE